MSDIIKYIKLGTDAKEWFNYDGEALPIRPLSTYEIDEIMGKVIEEGITQSIFDSLFKVKMNLVEQDERVDINHTNYLDFFHYFNEIDYWTVYFAMKDFQEPEFSAPDYRGQFKEDFKDWVETYPKGYYIVKKMKFVHDIANDVKKMTSQPPKKLVELLKNREGKTLASMTYVYHLPLANTAWKLTPLQSMFLYFSKPGAPEILDSEEDLPGIKAGSIEEITKQLQKMGFDK